MRSLLPGLGRHRLAATAAAAVSKVVSAPPGWCTGASRKGALSVLRTLPLLLSPCRFRSLRAAATSTHSGPPNRQHQQQQCASTQNKRHGAEDAFYAIEAGSFQQLGLSAGVVEALHKAGFTRPSRVQELVIPKLLSGKPVVLAAETGSGKTLAYIAPMASLLLAKAASGQQPPAVEVITGSSSSSRSHSSSSAKQKKGPAPRWMGLVLCPNTALCRQVVRLVDTLQGEAGQPLLRAAYVSSSSPPPFDPPDIVVSTPGALRTLFNMRGMGYGPQWTAEAVALRSAAVVVDEADLLWQGGYVKDLTRLLDALKAGERRVAEAQVLQELQLDRAALERLPRRIKEAAWKGGVPAMKKAGLTQGLLQRLQQEQQDQQQDHQQQQQQEGAGSELQQQVPASAEAAGSAGSEPAPGGSGSSKQVQAGPLFKRQYVFVAATMPSLTKGDVGTELQKRFPGAVWVSGDMLHQVKPHVEHTWVAVGQGEVSVQQALLAAITSDPDYKAGRARLLVFTANTANADKVAALLADHGVPTHLYHKNLPPQDQSTALSAMASPTPGQNLVLVSTDAAARGIDLPDVTHVIQADFVANAIEFLHRVGRTARAGRSGKVTSLYGPSDAVLADALRQYVDAGQPIEDCFSRNRSFSRKVKRYGQFVPRGQEGPQTAAARR